MGLVLVLCGFAMEVEVQGLLVRFTPFALGALRSDYDDVLSATIARWPGSGREIVLLSLEVSTDTMPSTVVSGAVVSSGTVPVLILVTAIGVLFGDTVAQAVRTVTCHPVAIRGSALMGLAGTLFFRATVFILLEVFSFCVSSSTM